MEKGKELWERPESEIYDKLDEEWINTLRHMGEEFAKVRDEHSAKLEHLASKAVQAESDAILATFHAISQQAQRNGNPLQQPIEEQKAK